MKSAYTIYGQLYRTQGFGLIVILLLLNRFEFNANITTIDMYLKILLIFGVIFLWVHPDILIVEDGVVISRLFGLIKYKIGWGKLSLFKRVRTITKQSFSKDSRYSKLSEKNGYWIGKAITILAFMKNYDGLIHEIEAHLPKENVMTDSNYRDKL